MAECSQLGFELPGFNGRKIEQIRAWVPGCSTGEEAYSLAILFHEEFERRGVQRDLIIFASDVDESALAVARQGRYPSTISATYLHCGSSAALTQRVIIIEW
jgi:chemotaxis methyl-accepting protein methylase